MKKLTSVLIATFALHANGKRLSMNGQIEPMLSFFLPKTKKTVLIDQPYPGSDILMPVIEKYEKEKRVKVERSSWFLYLLVPFLKRVNYDGTHISFKIRDFLSVLDFGIRSKTRFDIFIGLESINTLAGIMLRKLGKVKTVVYYVSDYSPIRYKLYWFNKLYLLLDQIAATHSDFIWDVSKAMMPARIKAGLDPKNAVPVIHVPNALFPEQISSLPYSKIIPNSLVYVGTLGKENGPDIAIQTLGLVAKSIPQATMHIYGDGEPNISRIKKLTEKLKLTDKVTFHGFIGNQVELSSKTKQYAIGLAPYLGVPGSPRWWADAIKIRLYLGAGVPVVTTQVPPLGKEVEEGKAGLIAKDNPKEQAREIIRLLKDKNLYRAYKLNAIRMGRSNIWKNTYSQALNNMDFLT